LVEQRPPADAEVSGVLLGALSGVLLEVLPLVPCRKRCYTEEEKGDGDKEASKQPMQQNESRSTAIVSISAPEDTPWLEQWEAHLRPLEQSGTISVWSARHLQAGFDRGKFLNDHLDQADLIVLLLSADFFTDDECIALMEHALKAIASLSQRTNPALALLAGSTIAETESDGILHRTPPTQMASNTVAPLRLQSDCCPRRWADHLAHYRGKRRTDLRASRWAHYSRTCAKHSLLSDLVDGYQENLLRSSKSRGERKFGCSV
jgi:hypothetical protein